MMPDCPNYTFHKEHHDKYSPPRCGTVCQCKNEVYEKDGKHYCRHCNIKII